MSRNIVYLCLIFILSIFIIGCAKSDSSSVEDASTKNWEIYSNENDKITFQFPSGFKKEFDTKKQSKSQQAFFTDYKGGKPFGFFDLPPKGGAHIGYISLPYNKVEFDNFITGRGKLSKKETTVMNLPAYRLEDEGPTNTGDPTLVEKETTYIFHDEGRTYSLFIEYFKGDPNGAKLEDDFEAMMKTVKRLS